MHTLVLTGSPNLTHCLQTAWREAQEARQRSEGHACLGLRGAPGRWAGRTLGGRPWGGVCPQCSASRLSPPSPAWPEKRCISVYSSSIKLALVLILYATLSLTHIQKNVDVSIVKFPKLSGNAFSFSADVVGSFKFTIPLSLI